MAKSSLAVAHHTKSLEQLENEVKELEAQMYEEWYEIGLRIDEIAKGKFAECGARSFKHYCEMGRLTICSSASRADDYMAAVRIRKSLPEVSDVPGNSGNSWTVDTAVKFRPLKNAGDVKRVAKKVVSRVKKGEPLSNKLVKEEVDKDLGKPRKAKERKAKKIRETPTLQEVISEETHRILDLHGRRLTEALFVNLPRACAHLRRSWRVNRPSD